MRITSAPRCASCIAQNGPAQTQLKSATRTPSSGNRCLSDARPFCSPDGRVRGAVDEAREDLPARPLGIPHEIDEPPPLVLLDDDEEDEPVLAFEDAPREEQPPAETRRDLLAVGVVDDVLLDVRGDVRLHG